MIALFTEDRRRSSDPFELKKLMNFTIWSDSYHKNNSMTYLIFNCA